MSREMDRLSAGIEEANGMARAWFYMTFLPFVIVAMFLALIAFFIIGD